MTKENSVTSSSRAGNRSKDFNIYYMNFSKVYEIAMMINNVVLTKVEKSRASSYEEQYGFSASLSAQGNKSFLDGVKASISAEGKEISNTSSKVVESLDVITTKSILLRRVVDQCIDTKDFLATAEGDLIKIDNVRLQILDEDSLRQFLILKRDALKGMRVEGVEINNLIGSFLQDYAYILKGTIDDQNPETAKEIIIKIPMDIKSEFENKYSIDDLLIGHVSIVGIYKGVIEKEFIVSNTFSYFQDASEQKKQAAETAQKVIKSDTFPTTKTRSAMSDNKQYHFLDTLAIIQDVTFDLHDQKLPKLHWWNKVGIWLYKLRRK